MAEDNDVERNFPATPRRLEQAREKGQIARSRELAAGTSTLAAALAFASLGPALYGNFVALMRNGLTLDRDASFGAGRMQDQLHSFSLDALLAVLPLLAVLLAAAVVAPLLLSGGVFSMHALRIDVARLNPLRGLTNMVSGHGFVELIKAVVKCVLMGTIGWWALQHDWAAMQGLAGQGARDAIPVLGSQLLGAFFALAGGLALIAVIDVPYQLWHHASELKMSREEIRQEQRESDGDPQQKARVRNVQRAMARKRMMAAVPKADVIIVNPEHYAVALAYREGGMRAPQVVAKGVEQVARRIREVGAEHGVPELSAPPLARALYAHTEIGSEIPAALFAAVAQVLAYVQQVQRFRSAGGTLPATPHDLEVPSALDPLHGGAAA